MSELHMRQKVVWDASCNGLTSTSHEKAIRQPQWATPIPICFEPFAFACKEIATVLFRVLHLVGTQAATNPFSFTQNIAPMWIELIVRGIATGHHNYANCQLFIELWPLFSQQVWEIFLSITINPQFETLRWKHWGRWHRSADGQCYR